ncbi:hypothetical protein DV735_g996, partial [Chaetothyriales sp. CBS 134920]
MPSDSHPNLPYDKAAGEFADGPFPLGQILDAPGGQILSPEQIRNHPATRVKTAIEQLAHSYRHRVNGLRELAKYEHTPFGAILVGSHLNQVEPVSIYRDILDQIPEPRSAMGVLNDSQEAVVRQCKAALAQQLYLKSALGRSTGDA